MTLPLDAALDHFDRNRTAHLNDLKSLIRIPSVSFPGFDAGPVRQCAEAVASLLRKSGLTDIRLLEAGTGHSMFSQWTEAPKPTISRAIMTYTGARSWQSLTEPSGRGGL
jgi:acetylornithine deacetylase/succinyl-diaminopimelate desuccinylase-like protein